MVPLWDWVEQSHISLCSLVLQGRTMIEIEGHEIPEHVSYSSLTTWLNCGWQYYMSRVQKIGEQPAWWFYGGSAVHAATEKYDRETL